MPFINVCNYPVPKGRIGCNTGAVCRVTSVTRGFAESGSAVQGGTAARRSRPDFQQIFCTAVSGSGSVNSNPAHTSGHLWGICHLVGTCVRQIVRKPMPGVGHLSILLEAAFPK